mmetsp:Transcript_66771/g.215188  ORF Transcript_66771/g.215188 Transcript_66771/m.215188 type:complete len:853 (-) Transcript_66771:86-2644(-)
MTLETEEGFEVPAEGRSQYVSEARSVNGGRQVDEIPAASLQDRAPDGTASKVTRGTLINNADLSRDIQRIAEKEGDANLVRVLRISARKDTDGEDLVPRESALRHLEEHVKRRNDCLAVPFVVFYYLFFVIATYRHERISDVSQMDNFYSGVLTGSGFHGIVVSGHMFMNDIDSVPDIYTYLHEAVLPAFLPDLNSTSYEDKSRVHRYSRLIGGLMMQQTRRSKENCAKAYPNRGPFDADGSSPLLRGISCYPLGDPVASCFGPGDAVDGFCPGVSSAGSRLRRLRPKKSSTEPTFGAGQWQVVHAVEGERFSLVLHEHDGLEEGLRRLEELKSFEWIDQQTSWLGIRLFALNPDLGIYTSALVNVFFMSTGEVLPIAQTWSFPAEPYQDMSMVATDLIFFVLWLQLFVRRAWTLLVACCTPGSLGPYFRSIFNWADWVATIMGFGLISSWIYSLHNLDLLKESVMAVVFNQPATAEGTSPEALLAYAQSVERMHSEVLQFQSALGFYRVMIQWFPLILAFRFLKSFAAQPKLASIVHTFAQAAPDIAHFLLVFVTLLSSFVISAMLLFGHRLANFSTIMMASQSCLLMLFGSMEYDELSDERPLVTMIWFFLFSISMVLIMLNMTLAIFMDVYACNKGYAELTETIWQQLHASFESLLGHKVPAKTVAAAIESNPEEMIGASTLCKDCPKMTEEQAEEIIRSVEAEEEYADNDFLSLHDAMSLVGSIHQTVHAMVGQINDIIRVGRSVREEAQRPDGSKRLDPDAEEQLLGLEGRVDALEAYLNEVMSYLVMRGKEARGVMEAMEKELRAQSRAGKTLWDAVTDRQRVQAATRAEPRGSLPGPAQSERFEA